MYACFQNIFFLKDWLKEDSILTNSELNGFINQNTEIVLCRDICTGTKHFNIKNASVDNEFGIIREFNPMSKFNSKPKFEILILADEQKYKPISLIEICVVLWNEFIAEKLNIKLEKASS